MAGRFPEVISSEIRLTPDMCCPAAISIVAQMLSDEGDERKTVEEVSYAYTDDPYVQS